MKSGMRTLLTLSLRGCFVLGSLALTVETPMAEDKQHDHYGFNLRAAHALLRDGAGSLKR